MFKPFIYPPQVEKLRAILPWGYRLDYYVNPLMKGLWVELDVSGIKDPRAAAADFMRRYPGKVSLAEIMVKVAVMRASAR